MKKSKIIFGIMLSLLFVFSKPSTTLAQNVSMTAAIQESPEQMFLELSAAFDTLKLHSIRPAEGYLKYDYLIPAGFYKQMWD